MRIIPRPSGLVAPAATVSGGIESSSTLTHGQEFTISGSGFGTRSDYNAGDYTWEGHRHMHLGFLDFSGGFASPGASQATWQSDSFWKGFFPAGGSVSGFNFNTNIVANDNCTLGTGGPSQSGKYFRKTSDASAQGGYVQRTKTNLIPADGITIYKCRGSEMGKIYRQWREDSGGDFFFGKGGAFATEGWPYDSGASTEEGLSATVFNRFEMVFSLADGTQIRNNKDALSFGAYIGGSPVGVNRLPFITADQGGKVVFCTWPNSVDIGGQFDVTDIYIDQTAARVELWSDAVGTIREIQLCKSWSDTSIVIACNRGELSLGAVKIKVIGADNAVISTIDGTLE